MEKQDAINSLVNAVAKQGRHKALANTMREVVPSIAQQDYIIIDWEGMETWPEPKEAEVSAMLKNIYLTNPIALLSVVFTNFNDGSEPPIYFYAPCTYFSVNDAGNELTLTFAGAFEFIVAL